MLLQTAVLLSGLILAASYSCSNRLYRGQRLNVSQYLCSRRQNFRLLFNNTGKLHIDEAFLSDISFRQLPQTLFSTNTTSPSPSHVTFTDGGDFVAVGMDGAVYWQAGVSGADFLELQDTGIAVLFAKNASTVQVLWKSLSMYSLRIVGGTNQTNEAVGRLEFYFNNTWGSVGNYGFSNTEAAVACRTLGFSTGAKVTNTFGQSTGPVWMDELNCNGREMIFKECPFGSYYDDDQRYWWGMVRSSSTHSTDVAISCQDTSLGVLPPTAHACTDRLYVGQSLSLDESLCAGLNGEYALRFSNRGLDTVIELWSKWERKWMMGMKNTMPAGVTARLDGDGVMRVVGSGTGLPYNLFSNTTVNASFMELQDNGVVRVVSANGSTGWRKAPDDTCYMEKRKFTSYDESLDLPSSSGSTLLNCMAKCDTYPTCKTVIISELTKTCYLMPVYPWDTNTTTYYEKTPGCSNGTGCYQSYPHDKWSDEPYIISSTTIASASACTAWCDSTATCVSAFYKPATNSCILDWHRVNETVETSLRTNYYYRKNPCTPVDPSQVPLLPVKACPTQFLPGSFLLSKQYLCSPNGQHVLTVEKDGRLLIDGGKWMSNDATNHSGYLQYTASNQLLLRLDDGSTPWKVDSPRSTRNPPAGYLALSDGGILQMFDSTGHSIWNHQNGFRIQLASPIDGLLLTNISQLVDSNATSCVRAGMARFRLDNASLNTAWNVVMAGRSLQCGNSSTDGTHSFFISHDTATDGASGRFRMDACSLLTAAAQECHFQCLCQRSLCDMLVLRYNGCSDPPGDICEVALE